MLFMSYIYNAMAAYLDFNNIIHVRHFYLPLLELNRIKYGRGIEDSFPIVFLVIFSCENETSHILTSFA